MTCLLSTLLYYFTSSLLDLSIADVAEQWFTTRPVNDNNSQIKCSACVYIVSALHADTLTMILQPPRSETSIAIEIYDTRKPKRAGNIKHLTQG